MSWSTISKSTKVVSAVFLKFQVYGKIVLVYYTIHIIMFVGKVTSWDDTFHDLQLCFGVKEFLVYFCLSPGCLLSLSALFFC